MTQRTKEERIDSNPFMSMLYQKNTTGDLPPVPPSKEYSYRWVRMTIGGKEDIHHVSAVLNMDPRLKVTWVKEGEIASMKSYEDNGFVKFKDVALVRFDKRMAKYWDDMMRERARLQKLRLTQDLMNARDKITGEAVFEITDSDVPVKL